MDLLYILFFILTFVLIGMTVRRYWRRWPTRLENKLERIDKRSGDTCTLSSLEGGISHEEKEATG
jgi:hypothetical protein